MPKESKKSTKSQSHRKVEAKNNVPPDVFDDTKGVKVYISEEELKKPESGKVTEKESNEPKAQDKPDEVENDEVELDVSKKETDDKSDLKVNQKESENENEAEFDERVTESKESQEESEAKDESKSEDSNTEEQDTEKSFYEKVLGEAPSKESETVEEEVKEEKESLNRSLFFLGGVVFVMTIVIATAAGFIFLNSSTAPKNEAKVTPTLAPTEVPKPTDIPREDFSFDVMNGSGEGGKAQRTADAIEALGYSINDIGNADSSDYSGLEVGFSEDVTDSEKKFILNELKEEFLEAVENEDLEVEGSSVLVIVGK